MRLPLLSLLASFVLGGVALAQAPALPQGEAHFAIVEANDGKTVGAADYSVATAPNGYQITSHGDMKLSKFSYSFSNANHLDSRLNIIRDELSGTVNGAQVTFQLASDATGRQFQVSVTANGKTTTNSFDRHQHTVLLPDLDAAAYLAMAHFAIEHPPTSWIVVPKQDGLLVPADYSAQPDVKGDFHGQPISAHHTSVTLSGQNAISVEVYYTSEGSLLEADLPEQNFYVVRDDFKLANRPHYTPPRNSAPPPPEQPGQAPQQPGQPAQQPPQYETPQGSPQPQIQPQALLQTFGQ